MVGDAGTGTTRRGTMRLPAEACWELLRSAYVGRLGYVLDERPVIVPVNYRVTADGEVLVASHAGAKVRAARSGALLCLQVDGTESLRREGWSVLATGAARVVEGGDVTGLLRRNRLRPWAADEVDLAVLAIRPVLLEGRRVRRWQDDGAGRPTG